MRACLTARISLLLKMNKYAKIYIVEYDDLDKAKRLILAKHLGCEYEGYRIVYNQNGKPLLYKGDIESEKISISHTDNKLAIAFAREDIGIDIERRDRKVKSSICKDIEQWTCYEAYGKRLGEGISRELLKQELPMDTLRTHTVGEYIMSVCCKTSSPDIITIIDNKEIQ